MNKGKEKPFYSENNLKFQCFNIKNKNKFHFIILISNILLYVYYLYILQFLNFILTNRKLNKIFMKSFEFHGFKKNNFNLLVLYIKKEKSLDNNFIFRKYNWFLFKLSFKNKFKLVHFELNNWGKVMEAKEKIECMIEQINEIKFKWLRYVHLIYMCDYYVKYKTIYMIFNYI